MTEKDRQLQSVYVKDTVDTDTVKISTIIIVVIVTAMFLCTYYMSSWSAVDILDTTFVQRHTNHFDNGGNDLCAKLTATVDEMDKSETSAGLHQQQIVPTTETVSDIISKQRSSKFRLAKRSLIGSRIWPSVMWSTLTSHKSDQYSVDRNREDLTDRPVELWDINSRSNYYNHWNTKSEELVGHHTLYDLTYGLHHNNELKYFDVNVIKNPSTIHYQSPLRPVSIYSILIPQTKLSTSKNEMFYWYTIGLSTLVKVGLIKFKLFGILKILFSLIFKLKLFLLAALFKFYLLLKFSKFFKKMFILPLFPILITLISIIIFSAAMYFLRGQTLNIIPANSVALSSISNLLKSLLSNLPSMLAQSGLKKSVANDKLTHIPINILVRRPAIFKFNDKKFSEKLDAES